MSCGVGEVTESLENELCIITTHIPMGGSPGDVSEEPVT